MATATARQHTHREGNPSARALPADLEPVLCTLVSEPFDDPDWTFEPKLDGLRVLCRFEGPSVELLSRRGNDQAFQFPEIAQALKESLDGPAILDGEIVCLDA